MHGKNNFVSFVGIRCLETDSLLYRLTQISTHLIQESVVRLIAAKDNSLQEHCVELSPSTNAWFPLQF